MVFPDDGIANRVFPPDMADYLNNYYREHGVQVLNRENVVGIEADDGWAVVVTDIGTRLTTDRVVAGIGIIPSVDLAREAGLAVGNGIIVDEFLRTARPEIYAAGDVADYPDPALGIRRRVEHADAARAMGRVAGRNMAGAAEPYRYLPLFYSDLFELGYEAVGLCDTRLEMVEDWQERFRKGVIYYMKDGRVAGVLLMDIWDRTDEGRALIESGETYTAEQLIGRIR